MDAREIITKLHEVLNMIKGFTAGYSSATFEDGYMMIEYNGKRYVVKLTEIQNPSENPVDDLDRLRWLV